MLVIHGDNLLASRQKLAEEINFFSAQPGAEIIELNGNNLGLTDLIQAVESGTLFGNKRLIVIEKLFSGKSKDRQKTFAYLKKITQEVIVWEDREIDGRTLTTFKTKILLFTIPSSLFQLLDSFFPGNYRISLLLLHKTLQTEAAELIFFMLVRHIKNLIIAQDPLSVKDLKIPEWRLKKQISQARMFGLEKLIKIYKDLLLIEWSIKNGKTKLSLRAQLDLFFASI